MIKIIVFFERKIPERGLVIRVIGTLRSDGSGCLRRLSWPRGTGKRLPSQGPKIFLKRPSRRCRRLCLHVFDFYHQRTSSFFFMTLTHSQNPDFPYECSGEFNVNDMDDSECLSEFRFHKSDLSVLSEALHLPNYFICQQGTICDGIEGLCIALRRFAYPCRLSDLIPRFGRPVPELSMISSLVVDTIYQEHNHRITQWNDTLLNPVLLETYARAIQQNGSPLHNCFGFIDGTVRPICRPDQNQRIVYNGHKRVHGLKYANLWHYPMVW